MTKDDLPCAEHNFKIGRLEAQVESLTAGFTRIEAKLDVALVRHDERIRNLEGDMNALRRIGAIVAVLWSSIIAGILWLYNRAVT